jgi:energy-coupling factor transport system substrate-specific component
MKAALRMWKNTRMIILVAVCAAIYGAALIAFKTAIPIIPGITEVRVANIFPSVLSSQVVCSAIDFHRERWNV